MSRLTGRVRFREGFRGVVVMQVEYLWAGMPAYSRDVFENNVDWRDANTIDLSHPNLRWLIDQASTAKPAGNPIPPPDHGAIITSTV